MFRRNAHVRAARRIRDEHARQAAEARARNQHDLADTLYSFADAAEVAAHLLETEALRDLTYTPAIANFVLPYMGKLKPPKHWNGIEPEQAGTVPIFYGRHFEGAPRRRAAIWEAHNFVTDKPVRFVMIETVPS